MSYTAISDWKYGMDRRRPQTSGVPGTLWILKNAVITRGGDIERAKKFELTYALPAGTFGYYSVRERGYVFGSGTTPALMPTGVQYVQLAAPGAPAMTGVLDVKGFDGKLYVIASFADGNVYHFYNGTRVSAWDTLADGAAEESTVASRLAAMIDAQSAYRAVAFGNVVEITAAVPGTGFSLATSTTENGAPGSLPTAVAAAVQANAAAVAEVLSSGSVTITGGTQSFNVNRITAVKAGSVDLISVNVNWFDSHSATANALAIAINNETFDHGHTAEAAGPTVTIFAPPGTGAASNGTAVTVTAGGDVTASTSDLAGGVTEVDARAQVSTVTIAAGTFDAPDCWTITLDGDNYKATGRASATGTSAYVNKRRVYSTAGSLFRYCKINDPTNWTDAAVSSGAGFINVANEVDGAETIVGAAKYNDLTAIFARNAIVTYSLTADAEAASIVQPLDNTGSLAPRSIVSYGANDVYFLDETGVRSLRTRDQQDAAFTSDVGSAIDPFVQQIVNEVGAETASRASAVIETVDGRYMLAIGRYIIVLSQFPSSRIVAWSYIDFGTEISDLVRVGRRIHLRAGDNIYVYGGMAGNVYPDANEFEIVAETPFISSKDPAGMKVLEGYDQAAEGTWRVQILVNPNDPTKYVDAGVLVDTTYHQPAIKVPGHTSHFAMRFTCSAAGFASLSSTAVHAHRGEQN